MGEKESITAATILSTLWKPWAVEIIILNLLLTAWERALPVFFIAAKAAPVP